MTSHDSQRGVVLLEPFRGQQNQYAHKHKSKVVDEMFFCMDKKAQESN